MTRTVALLEAQKTLPALLQAAKNGDEIVIMDEDRFVLRLANDAATPPARVANLHPGALQPSDDFDAPLPNAFWLGASTEVEIP